MWICTRFIWRAANVSADALCSRNTCLNLSAAAVRSPTPATLRHFLYRLAKMRAGSTDSRPTPNPEGQLQAKTPNDPLNGLRAGRARLLDGQTVADPPGADGPNVQTVWEGEVGQ